MQFRINLILRPVYIFLLTIFSAHTALALPNTLKEVGSLYDNGHPINNESGEIISIAASGSRFLYVSFSGFTNMEGGNTIELHTWNLSNPRNPQLIARYDLSNPGDRERPYDPSLLAPHDMIVIKDHLVFWRNFELFTYKIESNGSLTEAFHSSFPDGLNTSLNRLSIGGQYVTAEQRLLTNNEFLRLIDEIGYAEAEDRIQENVLINLQDPAEPFMVKSSQSAGLNYTILDPPPTGAFNGLPARVSVSDDNLTISFLKYEQRRNSHLESFWRPVLRQVIKPSKLRASLSHLSQTVVSNIGPSSLQRSVNLLLERDLNFPERTTLSTHLSSNYDQNALLSSLLAEFSIEENDSVEFALKKIVSSLISSRLEGNLRTRIAQTALNKWIKTVFPRSPKKVQTISSKLNKQFANKLKRFGLDRYLVDFIMGPTIGLPSAFRVRLRTLVNAIADSSFGQATTVALTTFHTILPVRRALALVGFRFPRCFDLPETSGQFLRLLLTSGGARLDLDNYAFIELLKLTSYYNGNNRYSRLLKKIKAKIKTFHSRISSDFALSLFKGLDINAEIASRTSRVVESVGAEIDVKALLTRVLVAHILELLSEDNISGSISVREVFESRGLYTEAERLPFGASLATNANLTTALNSISIGGSNLTAILRATDGAGRLAFVEELTGLVDSFWLKIFGPASLEQSLESAIFAMISQKLKPNLVGDLVENLIGSNLTDISSSISLSSILGTVDLAAKGDCIAQYQLSLLAISAAPTIGGLAEAAQLALSEAQEASLNYVVETMLSSFFSAIFTRSAQHYASWDLQLVAETTNIPLAQLTARAPQSIDTFVAGNRIGLVLRDVGSLGWFPGDNRSVEALVFDPDDIPNTLQSISLGDWDSVTAVSFTSTGTLVIGGEQLNENEIPESVISVVDFLESDSTNYQLRGENANELKNLLKVETLSNGLFVANTLNGKVILFSEN